jgi:hypothetical protein
LSSSRKRMLYFILFIQTVYDSVCSIMRGKIIDPLRMIQRERERQKVNFERIEEIILSSLDWMT